MENQEKMLSQPEARLELPAGKKHISTLAGIIIIVLVAVILFGGVFAYQHFFVSREFRAITPIQNNGLAKDIFNNGKYKILGLHSDNLYQFNNGQYVSSWKSCSMTSCRVINDVTTINKIYLGDINNDKVSDAVIILKTDTVEQGFPTEMAVATNKDGTPYYVDSVDLGAGTFVNFVKIDSEIITVDMDTLGRTDPSCCPSQKKIAKYELLDGKLVEQPSMLVRWQDKYGLQIQYPKDFISTDDLTAEQRNSLMTYMGTCNGLVSGLCYIGSEKSDGFATAALSVDISTTTSIEDCQNPESNPVPSTKSTPEVINGITFYHSKIGEAGLGHFVNTDSYRTYYNGACYTIDLSVESNRGVSEKGLSVDFSNMMSSKLKSILSTFKFTK